MPKSAQIFLQTSADICRKNFIATNSFFYTVISLNIKWSHINFAIQIMIFLKKIFNMFEKIILFCTSIYIWKLISQKTQNNFFSAQIIVPWAGMCGGVHGYVRVCVGVGGCARLWVGMCGCAWVCVGWIFRIPTGD